LPSVHETIIKDKTSTQRTLGYVLDVGHPDKRARCSLEVDARHLNWHGVAHGGIVSCLLDSACGSTVSLGVDPAARYREHIARHLCRSLQTLVLPGECGRPDMTVRLERLADRIVIHNRAQKRGALSPEFYAAIREATMTAEGEDVRSILLTGGLFFCAGGDLDTLATRSHLPETERREKIEVLHDVIRAMRDAPVPLIAAVEGGAAGAGLSLVLACDFVVAARDAAFTAAYVKAGLTPDGGLTWALARSLPHQMAARMCLLGEPVSAVRLALARHNRASDRCCGRRGTPISAHSSTAKPPQSPAHRAGRRRRRESPPFSPNANRSIHRDSLRN